MKVIELKDILFLGQYFSHTIFVITYIHFYNLQNVNFYSHNVQKFVLFISRLRPISFS